MTKPLPDCGRTERDLWTPWLPSSNGRHSIETRRDGRCSRGAGRGLDVSTTAGLMRSATSAKFTGPVVGREVSLQRRRRHGRATTCGCDANGALPCAVARHGVHDGGDRAGNDEADDAGHHRCQREGDEDKGNAT